jgi:hypothetical protein
MDRVTARVDWGKGAVIGSFAAVVDANGAFNILFSVSTQGKVWLQFGHLKSRPPFEDWTLRGEFAGRLSQIDGLDIGDDKIDRWPTFSLARLSRAEAREKFENAMDWAISAFRRYDAGPAASALG